MEVLEEEVETADISGYVRCIDTMAIDIQLYKDDFQVFALDEEHVEEYKQILDSFKNAYDSLDVLCSLLARYQRIRRTTNAKV